jgi:glycosyltransferase involved in cell wall biosynthesis
MRIFHIVPHLGTSSLSRDLLALVAHSPGAAALVCTLQGDGEPLRGRGVPVETLAWNRPLDPRPLWRLGRLLDAEKPDAVHVWGLPALRTLRLAAVLGKKWPGRVVVNRPLSSKRSGGSVGTLDRWLLRGADCLVVASTAEAGRCLHMGIPQSHLRLVKPGVAPQTPAEIARKTIVCAGALQPYNGFWDAIWTMDILHFACADIELVIAGEGPDRPRLERFAENTGLRSRIHFTGEPADLRALLRTAAVVWVPSRVDSGARVALEAMAAGRPVIASRWPALAEAVVDGETGWLIEPGDKMALAQKTRRLLDDPQLCRSMGAAARRRVEEEFSVQRFVRSWWQQAACGELKIEN